MLKRVRASLPSWIAFNCRSSYSRMFLTLIFRQKSRKTLSSASLITTCKDSMRSRSSSKASEACKILHQYRRQFSSKWAANRFESWCQRRQVFLGMLQLSFDTAQPQINSALFSKISKRSVRLTELYELWLTKSSRARVRADSRREISALRFSSTWPRGFDFINSRNWAMYVSCWRLRPMWTFLSLDESGTSG